MAKETIDEIMRLSPAERIRRLKELEEQKKKEIEEAEDLIKESMSEMRRDEIIRDMPPPKMRGVDITKLWDEEKPSEKKLEERWLEESVAEERPKVSEEDIRQYGIELSKAPTEDIYGKVKDIYQSVQGKGYVSPQQRDELESISYALQRKEEDIHEGKYKGISSEVSNMLVITQDIAAKMKSLYTGK